MFPVLNIGPVAVQTAGLILLGSLWLGLSLSEKAAPHYKSDPNTLYNLFLVTTISGILAARLIYAGRNLELFLQSPLNLFSLNSGLLDIPGGTAFGLVAALIYGNRKQIPLWPTLDALTPLLALLAIGASLSHLAAGSGFGNPTTRPWGIELWGAKRHPSQIYEMMAGILILSMIWPPKGDSRPLLSVPGATFWMFLALSAGARLFLEAFRGDSALLIGNVRAVQVLAWVTLAVSLWGLGRLKNAPVKETLHKERTDNA